MRASLLLGAGLGVILSASAVAGEYTAGDLVIDGPWTRATAAKATVGAGYMTITNNGSEADRLIGGSVPFAGTFEVHEMEMTDGVMKMREIEGGLVIEPGATVELKPGGYHVMFIDLVEPLSEGETVRGTLTFEQAGTVEIEMPVAAIGATNNASHTH